MKAIGEIIREKNIILNTADPIAREGFTQLPNFILYEPAFSPGAKVTYAMFLSYAWHNDSCFPGQDTLAAAMGLTRPRVTQLIAELEEAGLIEIQRRGQGLTNLYTVNFRVKRRGARPEVSQFTSRSKPADIQR